MTFPTVAARASGVSGTVDVTSHAITLPAGIVAGDLLLVFFSADNGPTCTAPADWFKYNQDDENANVTGAFFYKWAAGGDTCTITTSTAQQSSHITYRITNGGVPSASVAWGTTANTLPIDAFTFQNDDFLNIVSRHGDSTIVATAAPTGYSNLQTKAASGTSGASTNTAEKNVTTTDGDVASGSFTSAAGSWVAFNVIIPTAIKVTQYVLDAFPSGGPDPTKWYTGGGDTGTSVNTSSGSLALVTPANSGGYISASWVPHFSMQPGQIYGVQLVTFSDRFDTATVGDTVESYPIQLYVNDGTAAQGGFLWSRGNITDDFDPDGNSRDTLNGFNTPPLAAKWFGMGRHTNGDLIWVYSPDGIHWRRHTSVPWPGWNVNNLGLSIIHGQYDVEVNADTMKVDNFMLGVVSGSLPTARVRRSGATVASTATKVRRSGAWVTPVAVKVKRNGAWVTPT